MEKMVMINFLNLWRNNLNGILNTKNRIVLYPFFHFVQTLTRYAELPNYNMILIPYIIYLKWRSWIMACWLNYPKRGTIFLKRNTVWELRKYVTKHGSYIEYTILYLSRQQILFTFILQLFLDWHSTWFI